VRKVIKLPANHSKEFGKMTHPRAFAHELKTGQWEVGLDIPGHALPDWHPDLHATEAAANLWIASDAGREWAAQKAARYAA
jgi:hypothetical protein